MNYYSHSKLNENEITEGSKELRVHVNGVKEKALFHFSEDLSLGYTDKELKEMITVVVDFHDLGKQSRHGCLCLSPMAWGSGTGGSRRGLV